jgi:transcriptional regulator GlxA family with amidase domain
MKVAIVIFDGVQALDVAGPLDVFAEANTILSAEQKYEVTLIGPRAGAVTCSNGMQLSVPFGYADLDTQWDLLLVAGGPQLPDAHPSSDFLTWLQNQARDAKRFGSVCNGAFVLAHAGLLDGKEVTTHWADAGRLAHEFPQASVQPDKIFVRDGRLFTSAGVTAGIDLALALIEEDLGHAVAMQAARRLVVFMKRPGGQSQFSAALAAQASAGGPFEALHSWMAANLRDDLTVERLAERTRMSPRTFARRYVDEVGRTPARTVAALRLEAASRWLAESRRPLKRIALECGFGSEQNLRRAFMRRFGVLPLDYRERFAAAEPLR